MPKPRTAPSESQGSALPAVHQATVPAVRPRPSPRARADLPATPGAVRLGPLGDEIGYNLQVAQAMSFQAFSALVGDTGLRPGRYALLQLINDNPGISQTTLSHATGRDKSTLTPLLADLERRGLVVREPDPADGRGRRLMLTEAGEEKRAVLAECAKAHDARLDRILGPHSKQQLLEMLRVLVRDLGRENGPFSGAV